jgi:hypothetical protein
MKKSIILSIFGALIASIGFAQAPTINITAPTGTVFVSSFPFNTNIIMQISHPAGLEHLQVFDAEVSQISPVSTAYALLTHIGNPFDQNGACSGQMTPANKISACSTNLGTANVSVMWQVPAAGTYSMKVTLKYQGNEGVDIEPVTFTLLLSVEYPAPPAIANAFINSNPTLKKGSATVRGCVVSQIAILHGQTHKYNPPPGPYNEALVQSDVTAFWPACSQK